MSYQYPCCDEGEDFDASVRCGRCEEWYHFQCVDVDESVADFVWFCATCLGEDRSTRTSLGAPGNTAVHPLVMEHAGQSGSSSRVGKSANSRTAKGRMSRAEAQDESDDDKDEIDEVGAKDRNLGSDSSRLVEANKENHEEFLHALEEVLSSYRNRVVRSKSVPVKTNINSNSTRSGLPRNASVPSAESTRIRALKELQELEEWNKLEELEEENQRKILELERKRISRQKKVIVRRMELRRIVGAEDERGEFVLVDEDFPELDEQPEQLLTEEVKGVRESTIKPTVPKSSIKKAAAQQPWRAGIAALPRPSFEGGATGQNLGKNAVFADEVVTDRSKHLERSSRGPINAQKGPTQLQIASRQVFPRSLPKFSGAAEEWPVFISAYNQANKSCGFSDAENLGRPPFGYR